VEKDLTAVAALDAKTAIAVGVDVTKTPLLWNGESWTQTAVGIEDDASGYVITGVDMLTGIASSSDGDGGGGDGGYSYDYDNSSPQPTTASAASTVTLGQHRQHLPNSKVAISNEARAANAAVHRRRYRHRHAKHATGTKPKLPVAPTEGKTTVPLDAAASAAAAVLDNTAPQATSTLDASTSALNSTSAADPVGITGSGSTPVEPQSSGNSSGAYGPANTSPASMDAQTTDAAAPSSATSTNDTAVAALPEPQGSPGRRLLHKLTR